MIPLGPRAGQRDHGSDFAPHFTQGFDTCECRPSSGHDVVDQDDAARCTWSSYTEGRVYICLTLGTAEPCLLCSLAGALELLRAEAGTGGARECPRDETGLIKTAFDQAHAIERNGDERIQPREAEGAEGRDQASRKLLC
jgi:hypothetical protein